MLEQPSILLEFSYGFPVVWGTPFKRFGGHLCALFSDPITIRLGTAGPRPGKPRHAAGGWCPTGESQAKKEVT